MTVKNDSDNNAVSRRLLKSETRVRYQASPIRICGDRSGIGAGFFFQVRRFPHPVSFHQCPTFTITYILLLEGQTDED